MAHLIGEVPVRLMKHTSWCACEGESGVSQQDSDTLRVNSISGFKSQEHVGKGVLLWKAELSWRKACLV